MQDGGHARLSSFDVLLVSDTLSQFINYYSTVDKQRMPPTSAPPLEWPVTYTTLSAGGSLSSLFLTSVSSPSLMRSFTGVFQPLHTSPDAGFAVTSVTKAPLASPQKPVESRMKQQQQQQQQQH
jgi:hypothetical protein